MNRQDLVNAIATETNLQKNEIEKTLLSMLRIIQERVSRGEDITLSDFGTFSSSIRQARTGYNPHAKKMEKFAQVRLVKFTIGKGFKKKLNEK